MKKLLTRDRLAFTTVALSCVLALVSAGATWAHECDHSPTSPCRDFCVGGGGPGCAGGNPFVTSVPTADATDLTFDFLIRTNIQFGLPSSVKVLEITDPQGEFVLMIEAKSVFGLPPFFVLTYAMGSVLRGELDLGPVRDNVGEHWVVHRELGVKSKITVSREIAPEVYGTGRVALFGDAGTITQGALDYTGTPSGSVTQAPAIIH